MKNNINKTELLKEAARRHRDNPGNGSAIISALVLEGKTFVPDEVVRDAIAKLAKLDEEIAGYEAMAQAGFASKAVVADMKARQSDLLGFMANVKEVGTGLHKAWVAKYLGVRKHRRSARINKGISPKKIRVAKKVTEKEHVDSFPVRTFGQTKVALALLGDLMADLEKARAWKPYKGYPTEDKKLRAEMARKKAENKKALQEARSLWVGHILAKMKADGKEGKPLTFNREDGRITRLPKTQLSKMLGIDASELGVKDELVVIHHAIEQLLTSVHWKLWADDQAEAEKAIEQFARGLYRRIAVRGIMVDEEMYRFVFSSASHQKDEKAVFIQEDLAKVHAEYLYFGMSLEEFCQHAMTGAGFLKAMANRTRPQAATLTRKDGTPLTVFDILPVKDVKRIYHHGKALSIGGNWDNKPYKFGPVNNDVIVGDGQGIALTELNLYGQLNGEGWKGLVHGSKSVIEKVCKRYNLTKEEFFDLQIETFDGRLVRLGDFAIICGEGCWKFDKMFGSFAEYLGWIKQLMPIYPGIERLSILRQLDDEEGEHKVRRLTRSLIQQFVWMDDNEIDQMIAPSVQRANNLKTMEGALRLLAGLDKTDDERTDLEHLFEECPWLICAPQVQRYLKSRYDGQVRDAMANRLHTKGQYPYIIQDPVALLEIWVLGKDPNKDDLGILDAGEISLEGVENDREVLAVRFPANYFTARTLINRPYSTVFASCANCAVLSIYDDILIRQDGDVDGDEMFICYDQLAVKLTKRMIAEFDPPVIIFEHGSKAQATAPGSVNAFWANIGDALYSAHHNGQVGVYANLARDCAYLMSVAYYANNNAAIQQYMLWMAAASTGAILAIDQVKGNAISETLIAWLEGINSDVKAAMDYKQPYTQQFLKKDVKAEDCLPPHEDVLTDRIAVRFAEQTGKFDQFDGQGYEWNLVTARAFLWETRWQMFTIHTNVLKDEIMQSMRDNYFNDETLPDGTEMDAKFLARVKAGQEVGLKDILLFWWHNERAMQNRLESKFAEAQEDFYAHCRESLLDFVRSDAKVNKLGRLSTEAERKTSLYNILLNEALEFTKGNGVEDPDGRFTMFILKLVAPWIRKTCTAKNGQPLQLAIPVDDVDADDTDWTDNEEEQEG